MSDGTPTNPNNAMMMLGNEQIFCRVEGGTIRRATRKLRLYYGPELYAAKPGTPGLLDKVSMFQPGYMKYVAAAGGTLVVPPAVTDVVTGKLVANPVVTMVPGTHVIHSVTATGVCVLRDAMGNLHASVQSITVDAELMFRQAILKNERADFWEILSTEDMEADKAAGKLRQKICRPLMEGYWLIADTKSQTVREAVQTYNNAGSKIRQLASSKAERLACDHNPVSRMTWAYGELWQDIVSQKDGSMDRRVVEDGIPQGWAKAGPPYVELDVVSWAESRGQAALEELVRALASHQHVEGVETVVVGSVVDAEVSEIDEEPDGDEPKMIAENPIPPQVIPPKPEPVPVVAATVVAPAVEKVTGDPRIPKLREQCLAFMADLPPAETEFCRKESEFGNQDVSACTSVDLLRKFRAELEKSSKAVH